MYAIHLGRPVQAAFWCEELIVTGLWTEAWSTLTQTWLFFVLARDSSWITNRMYVEDAAELHRACYRLCIGRKDNSLWYVLQDANPDTLSRKIPDLPFDGPLDRYLCAAICQGKGASAWWAAQQLGPIQAKPRIPWTPLEDFMKAVGLIGEKWARIEWCASVLLACSIDEEVQEELPVPVQKELDKWRAIPGVRKRRVYGIYPECLYGLTRRGCSSESTLEEGRRIDDVLLSGAGGTFWNFQGDIDEFYETFFPDDIPDEWSLADVLKSHGPGLKGALTLGRLNAIWMTHESIFAWSATVVADQTLSYPFQFCDIACEKLIGGYDAAQLTSRYKQLQID